MPSQQTTAICVSLRNQQSCEHQSCSSGSPLQRDAESKVRPRRPAGRQQRGRRGRERLVCFLFRAGPTPPFSGHLPRAVMAKRSLNSRTRMRAVHYTVKRHRGEPGHTGHTRDTRAHKGTRYRTKQRLAHWRCGRVAPRALVDYLSTCFAQFPLYPCLSISLDLRTPRDCVYPHNGDPHGGLPYTANSRFVQLTFAVRFSATASQFRFARDAGVL